MKENVESKRTLTLGLFMFAGFLVAIFALILLFGQTGQADKFVGFVITIIPLTIGTLYLSNQNNDIRSSVDGIKTKVNGELDAKFAAVHQRLDEIQNGTVSADPLPDDSQMQIPLNGQD
jgi:hypothetical protein